RHAEGRQDLLRQLRAWGHLVANHTYSHPGLVRLARSGGDVLGEVAKTDELIREHVTGRVAFFRAPYGNWRDLRPGTQEDAPRSVVAEILNGSGRFGRYVGPVNWDLSAQDYDCWRLGVSAEEAARKYLQVIEERGQGIVLLHDSSADEEVRARNQTA